MWSTMKTTALSLDLLGVEDRVNEKDFRVYVLEWKNFPANGNQIVNEFTIADDADFVWLGTASEQLAGTLPPTDFLVNPYQVQLYIADRQVYDSPKYLPIISGQRGHVHPQCWATTIPCSTTVRGVLSFVGTAGGGGGALGSDVRIIFHGYQIRKPLVGGLLL